MVKNPKQATAKSFFFLINLANINKTFTKRLLHVHICLSNHPRSYTGLLQILKLFLQTSLKSLQSVFNLQASNKIHVFRMKAGK